MRNNIDHQVRGDSYSSVGSEPVDNSATEGEADPVLADDASGAGAAEFVSGQATEVSAGKFPEPRGNPTPVPVAAPALDQLRNYVTALVDVIATHPEPSLERDEALWRVEELATELSVARPSAPRVKSRWIRLAPVLLEVRPDVPVPALNTLIDKAFTEVG